ncbi:MAG TPA: hypothetical protein VJC21_05880 [Candidatus Nanoarchaeia archaeon]|nr:hypothetical protein [Candidatus Nanoarchaeia archaeon]
MNEYKRVRISDLVQGGRSSLERVEMIGVVTGDYPWFRERDNILYVERDQFKEKPDELSYNFTLQSLYGKRVVSVVSRERTSRVMHHATKLEKIIARAGHNKKPVRVRGEYDSSRNKLIADNAEIITETDGKLSFRDVTEQDGQLSLADGGELSFPE